MVISVTVSIRYKGHLYKGQLVKMMTFTKQCIRDASLEASSVYSQFDGVPYKRY